MILDSYKQHFAELLAPHVFLEPSEVQKMIELPPQADMGDLAFPCFTLAKTLKKAPQVLATEIASEINKNLPANFAKVIGVGPYINIFIDTTDYVQHILGDEKTTGNPAGKSTEDAIWTTTQAEPLQKKILLEYMSWNPNKPLHVGHARNVCIGDTLRRVYTDLWYSIQTSHYGDDSGVNVWYNILGHLSYDIPLDPPAGKKFDHYCGEVYLQMRGKDDDPDFKEKLSKTLHAIETNSDAQITAFHKEYVKRCTVEQLRSCRRIGASFNMINRETDVLHLNLFEEALELLKTRGHVKFVDEEFLAEKSKSQAEKDDDKSVMEKFTDAKWCWIIDFSDHPLFQKEEKQYSILVKSDGVATYVAKDIAFAMWKLGFLSKQFHFYSFAQQPDVGQWTSTIYSTTSDESIGENITFGDYNKAITIIDNRQIPSQTVVKSALEMLGFLSVEKEYAPLGYGVVYLTPQTLLKWWFELTDEEKQQTRLPFASRKWWTVSMDEMLDLLHQKAYEETKKRNEWVSDDQLQKTAESIAVSSFRFFLTKTDILKDITFDIDEVLDMEWETGAYVLYTNARIHAIMQKVGKVTGNIDLSLLTHPLEIQLVKKIDELSTVQEEVIANMAPHLLGRYLISVCQLFNTYYNEVHISNSADDLKVARIVLLQKLVQTLAKTMTLLGMQPVERM